MQNEAGFLLVGVTGGIGGGKSTVCSAFARLGRMVISADQVGRELTGTDRSVLQAIRREFGPEVFTPDGSLDRAALAARAFADKTRIARLNALIHPRVFEQIDSLLAAAPPSAKHPYVIVEAALIYESGMDARLDRVIVVDAPLEVRIRRVMERDHCSRDDILRRIAAQMPQSEKLREADFVIVNDRNTVSLDAKAAFIDRILRALPPSDLP